MKQNLLLTGLFFIVLFGMKYIFDKSDVKTMLVYSITGAIIFFAYRTFVRPRFTRNKNDQEN
ncbi:hypothetical protein [Faecalibacter rhinopitheci]|uniref:Uncharacterized protein n=1 Tax=Faecalibacter rhinopitheci TaxID=2779678 RepID=A0A8J7KCT3_9FLAO|nr:hypothetical protein [Faecalibacter rhinopitheci]MBF0596596.1 hypothetical protein [Faecalibacter rhinopitheci]MBQ0148842.1 hypothetical protein [Candidatus Onthonaster equi]